jgi:hypothetical protein
MFHGGPPLISYAPMEVTAFASAGPAEPRDRHRMSQMRRRHGVALDVLCWELSIFADFGLCMRDWRENKDPALL